MSYFPKLDPATLKALSTVCKLYEEDPNYFNDADCPYGGEVEDLIKSFSKKTSEVKISPLEEKDLDLLKELKSTFRDLEKHKPDPNDAAATMTYYRTKTTLIEKLTEQQSRNMNQKQISDFYMKVREILEKVCTPTQRELFRTELKEFAGE